MQKNSPQCGSSSECNTAMTSVQQQQEIKVYFKASTWQASCQLCCWYFSIMLSDWRLDFGTLHFTCPNIWDQSWFCYIFMPATKILVAIIISGTALVCSTASKYCVHMYSVHKKFYLHYWIKKLASLLVAALCLMTIINKTSSGWWSFPIKDTDLNQGPRWLQIGSCLCVDVKRTSTLNLVCKGIRYVPI